MWYDNGIQAHNVKATSRELIQIVSRGTINAFLCRWFALWGITMTSVGLKLNDKQELCDNLHRKSRPIIAITCVPQSVYLWQSISRGLDLQMDKVRKLF